MKLKEKYKFYLFVDEAHAIGAVGPNGCGVADYYNIDPKSIDLLMATFIKSFGATGGYVAGENDIIDWICIEGYSYPYAEAMSIPVLTQVIASIMGVAVPTASTSDPNLTLRNNGHLPVDDEYHNPGPAPTKIIPVWMSLSPELASGEEGGTRLCRLVFNSIYLHRGLDRLGFVGHLQSSVMNHCYGLSISVISISIRIGVNPT
ncbi:serine palmitoyltransferase component [Marasmius sp. AFHP31]|nr:serine palmitoyltransferase component [Marasmius sp. AFHP31]